MKKSLLSILVSLFLGLEASYAQDERVILDSVNLNERAVINDLTVIQDELYVAVQRYGLVILNEQAEPIRTIPFKHLYGRGRFIAHVVPTKNNGYFTISDLGDIRFNTGETSSAFDGNGDIGVINDVSYLENHIYLGTSNKGLLSFNVDVLNRIARSAAINNAEHLGSKNDVISFANVEAVAKVQDELYVGGELGLGTIGGKIVNIFKNIPVDNIIENRKGGVLVSSQNEIWEISAEGDIDLVIPDVSLLGLSPVRVNDMEVDDFGNLWLVSDKVLAINLGNFDSVSLLDGGNEFSIGTFSAEEIAFLNGKAYIGTKGSGLIRLSIPQVSTAEYEKVLMVKTLGGIYRGLLTADSGEVIVASMSSGGGKYDTLKLNQEIDLGDLYFERSESAFKKDSYQKLDSISHKLRVVSQLVSVDIEVYGYTSIVSGQRGTNYARKLSQKRADLVKSELVKRGVDRRRIRSIGKGQIKVGNSVKNRKVMFRLIVR